MGGPDVTQRTLPVHHLPPRGTDRCPRAQSQRVRTLRTFAAVLTPASALGKQARFSKGIVAPHKVKRLWPCPVEPWSREGDDMKKRETGPDHHRL